jgi:hypothetical protein
VQYQLESNQISYDEVQELYQTWVNQDEGFVLQLQYGSKHNFKKRTIAVKCAKRGNDVYRYRVNNRLKLLSNALDSAGIKISSTRANTIFVTLTTAASGLNIREAWDNIGKRWNRFLSALKKRYGPLDHVRAWESTERGYPHVHAEIIFHEAEFNVFEDKEGRWRIQEKEDMEELWDSFIDVQVPKDVQSAKDYILKEIFKHGFSINLGIKTLAMLWVFHKRAFSLSRGLDQIMARLDVEMHNSNQTARALGLFGLPIDDFQDAKWVFVGVFSWHKILDLVKPGQKSGLWAYELTDAPHSKYHRYVGEYHRRASRIFNPETILLAEVITACWVCGRIKSCPRPREGDKLRFICHECLLKGSVVNNELTDVPRS